MIESQNCPVQVLVVMAESAVIRNINSNSFKSEISSDIQ